MTVSEPATPAPTDPAPPAAARVLRGLLATMHEHIPGTIEASDPEHLHDLRIAIRRTRSVLRELADLFPPEVLSTNRQLFSELAEATGASRDLDVHLLGWNAQLEGLDARERDALAPVRSALERQRDAAHDELRRVLESTECTAGLRAWETWLEEAEDAGGDHPTIGEVVANRLGKLHHRLVRDGRRIKASTPGQQLHELRKDGKRLRYLVDCFSPMFGRRARKDYVAQLKALQDNLGAHQDAEVQLGYLRELAHHLNDGTPSATDTVLALGRLSGRVDARRHAERAAFAKRFARFDRKRTEQLLEDLLASGR